MSTDSAQRIVPLTSARFLAALYVVLYHTFVETGNNPGRFLGLGFVSVNFFFVLSGYILAIVYLKPGKTLNTRQFLTARFARIYPLFAATAFLHTPIYLAQKAKQLGLYAGLLRTARNLVGTLFMLQAWDIDLRGIDNPNWSLSAETLFYLVFPLLAFLAVRRKSRNLLIVAGLSYISGMILIHFAGHLPLEADTIKFSPLLHLHEFVEGVCVGLVVMRLSKAGQERIRWASNGMLFAAACVFALAVIFSRSIPHFLMYDGLLSPLFSVVIVALAFGDGAVHRVLSHPRMELLGEASYALYLLHAPIWSIAKHLPHGHDLRFYPVFLFITIGLSILSFRYLEIPARHYLLRKLHTKPKETVLSGSVAQ